MSRVSVRTVRKLVTALFFCVIHNYYPIAQLKKLPIIVTKVDADEKQTPSPSL
jgi:hypothetical protein